MKNVILALTIILMGNNLFSQDYFYFFLIKEYEKLWVGQEGCDMIKSKTYSLPDSILINKEFIFYKNFRIIKRSDSSFFGAKYSEFFYSQDFHTEINYNTKGIQFSKIIYLSNRDSIFDENNSLVRIRNFKFHRKKVKKIIYKKKDGTKSKQTCFYWRNNSLIEKQKNYKKNRDIVKINYNYFFGQDEIIIYKNKIKYLKIKLSENSIYPTSITNYGKNRIHYYYYNSHDDLIRTEGYLKGSLYSVTFYNRILN